MQSQSRVIGRLSLHLSISPLPTSPTSFPPPPAWARAQWDDELLTFETVNSWEWKQEDELWICHIPFDLDTLGMKVFPPFIILLYMKSFSGSYNLVCRCHVRSGFYCIKEETFANSVLEIKKDLFYRVRRESSPKPKTCRLCRGRPRKCTCYLWKEWEWNCDTFFI